MRKMYKIKTNNLEDCTKLYNILQSLKCKKYNGGSLRYTQLGQNVADNEYTDRVCTVVYNGDKWFYYGYIDMWYGPDDQVFDLTVNEFVASFSPRRQLL